MKNSTKKINNSGFLDHLVELRSRLLYIIGAILICLLVLMPFANDIYAILAKPLFDVMPENSTMIAVDVASPFLAPFKLVLLMSVALTIPYTLYQLWAFIAPGLYDNEKKLVAPVIIFSTGLFYAGMCFAYFILFPLHFSLLKYYLILYLYELYFYHVYVLNLLIFDMLFFLLNNVVNILL